MPSQGLHHITAVAGDPQQNYAFYAETLGLRLIKKTVNFDDPSTYHLFYGDKSGQPGSIISFFADQQFSQGEPDLGQAVAVSFSIPASSVDFWVDYLEAEGLDIFDPFERFGKLVVGFQDPDGLHLELVGDPEIESTDGRGHQSIPDEHAIRGLHGVTLAEENYLATGQLLTESLGFEEVDQQHDRILFQADTALGSTIELIDGAELDGKPGKGTVHHIAFRAEDRHQQDEIRAHLKEIGYHLTENQDRHFFQSFFFHEPGGALVEVATDNPGFTIDEDKDELGTKLSLPPQLEQKRSLIEAELPTLILKP
jgi:glyoxalase family protein